MHHQNPPPFPLHGRWLLAACLVLGLAGWLLLAVPSLAGPMLALLATLAAVSALAWRSLRGHAAAQANLQAGLRADLLAAQGRLAAQESFAERLFQVSPIPLVVKDNAGRFLRVNQAWVGLTGISASQAIGHNLGRLLPVHLAAPHEAQEQLAMAAMQPVSYEEQVLDSDGLPRDVITRVTPFADTSGHAAGVIACLMDVTEFREAAQRTTEAKDAAEQASATKSEFLANISHELRTPLQSILGFSELATQRGPADVRLESMLASIHAASQRMLVLVNDLLDLSRLESPVGEIACRPQDICPPLRAVGDELQGLAQARGLRLQMPPATAPALWASADAFRLQQVLRNVLANAIRFAPTGSVIVVDWCSQPGGDRRIGMQRGLDGQVSPGRGSEGRFNTERGESGRFNTERGESGRFNTERGESGRFNTERGVERRASPERSAEHRISVRDHGPGIPGNELDCIFEAFVQSSRTKDGAGGTGLGLAICRKIMAGHGGVISARNHADGGAVFDIVLPALAASDVAAALAKVQAPADGQARRLPA